MIYYSGEAGSARLSADGGESFLASLKGKFLAVQLGGSFSSAGVLRHGGLLRASRFTGGLL